jgi:hypothetical protein
VLTCKNITAKKLTKNYRWAQQQIKPNLWLQKWKIWTNYNQHGLLSYSRNSQPLMEPEGSLLCPQELVTDYRPQTKEPSPQPPTVFY